MFKSAEGAEDSSEGGREAMLKYIMSAQVISVIGIAASGATPFVAGALKSAKERGASTGSDSGRSRWRVVKSADLTIAPDVGPEVIAGSTRMKNGPHRRWR